MRATVIAQPIWSPYDAHVHALRAFVQQCRARAYCHLRIQRGHAFAFDSTHRNSIGSALLGNMPDECQTHEQCIGSVALHLSAMHSESFIGHVNLASGKPMTKQQNMDGYTKICVSDRVTSQADLRDNLLF